MTDRFKQASEDPSTALPAWHSRSVSETARRLDVDPSSGLSETEAARRLATYGLNTIQERSSRRPLRILWDQFTDFMIMILIMAAVVSGLIGEPLDAAAIMVIVLLNGAVGFLQEYRAERAVAALKLLAAPDAKVLREGKRVTIQAAQLVPGDVVVLEAGDGVPADLRLIETVRFKVDESTLTGESVPVEKQASLIGEAELPLGDRLNIAHKGTFAIDGRGIGLVTATGMNTELGKIAALLREEEEVKTPLQKRLAAFGRRLATAVLAVCVVVFLAGLFRGESAMPMFLTAVSLAVAAIPEALPAVVTVSLALGARRLAKQRALVRRLPAVETLGAVTYICSDKTGTLTLNSMRVEQVDVAGLRTASMPPVGETGEAGRLFGLAVALNNNAVRQNDDCVLGDPTEVALYLAARDAGYRKEDAMRSMPRLAELPFDSNRKCMTTVHRDQEGFIAFTKGAPEQILSRCERVLLDAEPVALRKEETLNRAECMAEGGLRVLAVAFRRWPTLPDDLEPNRIERELILLGLVGLMDPPRPEACEAVKVCRSAGITPVMVTGDHPATARTIALRLGICSQDDAVITGQELISIGREELESLVKGIRVYARVAPEQKITIVKALQSKGEFVAMTGDGANDAPALRRADIGVAMGITGTDVAREASHMILLDDNFATIVAAVREGRRIFDNIRRFIKYTMTSNAGEIWAIFLAPFFGLPIPLLPIHILWINLVTDGLPGLALTAEPEERDGMRRPPRPPQESIFAHGLWQDIVWVGLLMGGVSLATEAWAYHTGRAHWQTMVFTVLTLSQIGNVLAIRSERESFFSLGPLTNRPLLGAALLTVALQMGVIYIPACNRIFKTDPLDTDELLLSLALSMIIFIAVEGQKWMIRRGWLGRA